MDLASLFRKIHEHEFQLIQLDENKENDKKKSLPWYQLRLKQRKIIIKLENYGRREREGDELTLLGKIKSRIH
ncbi:hypothetical protein CR513_50500, partial [Mucuna pruriens]